MTQFKDIPQPTDQRNVSQSDILSNFQYLATAQGGPPAGVANGIIKVDHEQFGNNITNPKDGFHNQVSFINRSPAPTNLTNAVNGQNSDSIQYTKADGASLSQPWFINSSIDAPLIFMKSLVLFSNTGAILGVSQNVSSVTKVGLPNSGNYVINFSVALPTLNYLVFYQGFSSTGNNLYGANYSNKQLNSVDINIFRISSGSVFANDPDESSVIIYGLF